MKMIVTMAMLKIKTRIFIMVIYIFVIVSNSLVWYNREHLRFNQQ